MKRFLLLPFIIVNVLVLLSFTGCDRQIELEPSGKRTKIGLIAPMSGPAEEWGREGLLGIKTALAIQPLLLNGDLPEIIIEDDQNHPELTRKALKKLVEVDEVSAIIIFSDSAAVLSVVEIADAYKTPLLILFASHPDVTKSAWANQFIFDDIVQGTVAALYVIDELLINHVAVIQESDNPHSQFLADEFTRKFEQSGGATEQVVLAGSKIDYQEVIQKLREKSVDFLYLPVSADHVINLEREARLINWNPQAMVSDGLLSQIRLQYADDLDLVDGMLATDLYANNLPRTEYGKRVVRLYKKKYGDDGTTFSALGCEGTSLLLAAIDKCGKSDNKLCINRMLRSGEAFSGIFGQIRPRSNGKMERPIFINQIQKNRLNTVVKIY